MLSLQRAARPELHFCGKNHIKQCLIYGGELVTATSGYGNIKQNKIQTICQNMQNYVKICKNMPKIVYYMEI